MDGVVIFTSAFAKHLAKDDPKVHIVVENLLDILNTPLEVVQRAVSNCLSPLMASKQASDDEKYDLLREGVVIFTRALAKHLAKDDLKVQIVIEKLLDVLKTPSETVQRAVSDCLSLLMTSK